MDGRPPEAAYQFRSDLLEWAETNLREFPWRSEERDFYEVFVAEFFLTQTPPPNVARVYPEFLDRFPDLETIDEASLRAVEEVIEPLGFQHMRAAALKEIAETRRDLPRDIGDLQSLTRVGPYVANATVCFALEEPVPIVDRNVVRAYSRILGGAFPESDAEREDFAEAILPESGATARTYNLALIDFGGLLCTKRDPLCEQCFASGYCDYYQSRRTAEG